MNNIEINGNDNRVHIRNIDAAAHADHEGLVPSCCKAVSVAVATSIMAIGVKVGSSYLADRGCNVA